MANRNRHVSVVNHGRGGHDHPVEIDAHEFAATAAQAWRGQATERLRRLVARRAAVVQGMTRTKNRIHAVLHANLIPPYSGKLFMAPGRRWLAEQPLAEDERAAVDRWLAALDDMEGELAAAAAELASACLGADRVSRLMTIGGVNMAVAAGVLSAVLTAAEKNGAELSAGDFVRWARQVVDLLDQVRNVAGADSGVGAAAAAAVPALRRGVVALGAA